MAETDTERLSDLIGGIYDAALDPALWIDVLERASAFVGGCSATIYSKDSVSRTADISLVYGVDDNFQRKYADEYVKLDPTTSTLFFYGVEEIVSSGDILPYQEFLETRFYKE